MSHISNESHKDKEYLKWLRQQFCVACKSPPPNDPHHCFKRFHDMLCIALCRSCHSSLHRVGKKTWQEKTGLYYENEIIKNLVRYVKFLREMGKRNQRIIDGIPNPCFSQFEVDRLLKNQINED